MERPAEEVVLPELRGRANQRDMAPQRSHGHDENAALSRESERLKNTHFLLSSHPQSPARSSHWKNLTRSLLAKGGGNAVCRNQVPAPQSRAGLRQRTTGQMINVAHCSLPPFQRTDCSVASVLPYGSLRESLLR